MRFTIKGSRNGSRVQVTWSDGVLTGDPPTLDLLAVEAELVSSNPGDRLSWATVADPTGALPRDPLRDPDGAWTLIASVLDSVLEGEGDLPAGAVARLARRRAPPPVVSSGRTDLRPSRPSGRSNEGLLP